MRCSICDYSATEPSVLNPESGNRKRQVAVVGGQELCTECRAYIALARYFEDERVDEEKDEEYPDESDDEGVDISA